MELSSHDVERALEVLEQLPDHQVAALREMVAVLRATATKASPGNASPCDNGRLGAGGRGDVLCAVHNNGGVLGPKPDVRPLFGGSTPTGCEHQKIYPEPRETAPIPAYQRT